MTINPWRVGAAFGVLLGPFHAAWAALVGSGWAQAFVDLILRLHFIEIAARVSPFDWNTAATLVILTTGLGFMLGWVFAWNWNWMQRERALTKAPSAR